MRERFYSYLLRYFTHEQVRFILQSMNDEVAIAGSFIVNFMYGGDAFTPNDIDFFSYVPGNTMGVFPNVIRHPDELGLAWVDTQTIYQSRVVFERIYNIEAKTALKLNHIDIKEPPVDFILRSFDRLYITMVSS